MQHKVKNIVIALACVAGLAACTTTSNSVPGLADNAKNTARTDPAHMIRKAHVLAREQKYGQAQDSFARILAILPENEEAQAGLAHAARLSGEPGQALKHYRQLEKYPARLTAALEGQGLVLVQLQRWAEAERVLLSALEHDGNLWRVWNALGQVRDQRHGWEEAEAAYFNAISLRPLAASLYNNLGVSYLCQLRYDDAIDQFERSLALKSSVEIVEANRVVALAMKGDYDAAMGGIPLSKRRYGLNNIGFAAMLNGDESQARAFLAMAEDQSPRYYQKAAENLKSLR